jgi:hypothetical protein
MASIITGVDGSLAPVTDYTLPYRADGIFDFSSINIGNGITVRFDTQTHDVTLLSLGDILIAGEIDAPGINLTLETLGRLVLTGSITTADSISLASRPGDLGMGTSAASGNLCLSIVDCGPPGSPLGRLPLPPGALQEWPGGDITLNAPRAGVFAVPEPSTLWLATLLLPMLALFGGKRVSKSEVRLDFLRHQTANR